jgi:hypothetical protein
MKNSIFIKNFFLLLLLTISANILIAQQQVEISSNTIVFKVKEVYRSKCEGDKIAIEKFNDLTLFFGVDKLKKMFPNKQKEDRKGNIDLSLIYELHYTNAVNEQVVINQLKQLKIFDYVEKYIVPQLTYTPSDTGAVYQYHLNLINAYNAWDINKGDTNIVIGITDTGWDPTHPDLIANLKINYADPTNGLDDDGDGYIDNNAGWDLGENDNDATFQSVSHGVTVVGLAAASTDNVIGVAGVGFNTKFLPIKISNAAGALTQAYQGVVYAADQGCFIINCSWGSYGFSHLSQDVINYAQINKGALVIAAVGNDNTEDKFYPAAYDGVLSVAATDQNDLKTTISNHGFYVDISAPGDAMWTTGASGTYRFNGGTSMAAPVVAGGAAIIKAQFPSYTNQQVAALLKATAGDLNVLNPTYVDKLGYGRLDLFDALSAVNPQFLELTTVKLTDNNNEVFIVGDTINIIGLFTNYLTSISGVSVSLSTSSPYINIVDGLTNLPILNALDTISNYNDIFKLEVLSGANLNESITVKAVITNGTYTNNEYFTFAINQDYVNLAENLVATTITSKGKIGFNDVNNSVGLGFTYKGNQLLYEAGLMIGDDATRVADAIRGVSVQDWDFAPLVNVEVNPPFISALDIEGTLNDGPLSSPMGIMINHKAYTFANAPDDKYVIVTYEIVNTSNTILTNLYAGIFADWDIVNPNLNKAGVDVANKMGYTYVIAADSVYAAIKLLSANGFNNYAIDLDGSGGENPNQGGFTTAEKYTTLSTNRTNSGGINGADVAHVVSGGSFSLAPGQAETVSFAIIAGDSLLDIQASAVAAQLQFDNNPISVKEINSSADISVYPNPTKGLITVRSIQKVKQIRITNFLGETILNTSLTKLDISSYANGIYFIEVLTEKELLKQKVILLR